MLRAVVPLVRAGRALVVELVADRRPSPAAIVRALDLLAKPAAGLRSVEAIGIDGRALQMVDLPAREVRAADFPLLAPAIGGEDEGALAGADEDSDAAHRRPRFRLRR